MCVALHKAWGWEKESAVRCLLLLLKAIADISAERFDRCVCVEGVPVASWKSAIRKEFAVLS